MDIETLNSDLLRLITILESTKNVDQRLTIIEKILRIRNLLNQLDRDKYINLKI